MKLSALVQNLPSLKQWNFKESEISGLAFNSQEVKQGNLFVAIPGTKVDGHQFIQSALSNGAIALVVESEISIPKDIPVFQVESSRAALSRLTSQWFGNPQKDLRIVGITGTNGKTTISCILEAILQKVGRPAGRLGTIGCHYLGRERKLLHTTPESLEIHQILREMVDHGVKDVVMEVSSHAVDMHRVDDIHFELAIFTNLTPEHLDYHQNMEHYFESKKRLFTTLLPKGEGGNRAIINAEDPYGLRLLEEIEDGTFWTYSTKAQSKWNLFPQEWHSSLQGLEGIISTPGGVTSFTSPMIGAFNVSNILAATGAALTLGVTLKTIVETIRDFALVPGRLERIPNRQNLHLFVDYAHTPDALKNVLTTLKDLEPPRILTVFGCGGDRDRTKRPIMGREVARFSDFVIVTSDNPRTEDPLKIIDDILPGIKEGGMDIDKDCLIEPNRRKAIELAIKTAKAGEVLLIAGKGHEDYQILGTERFPFDDRKIAREILEERAGD